MKQHSVWLPMPSLLHIKRSTNPPFIKGLLQQVNLKILGGKRTILQW